MKKKMKKMRLTVLVAAMSVAMAFNGFAADVDIAAEAVATESAADADNNTSASSKTAITSSLNRKENRDDSKRIKTGTHNSGESRIDGKGTPQNPF